jgi:hypothetical protein
MLSLKLRMMDFATKLYPQTMLSLSCIGIDQQFMWTLQKTPPLISSTDVIVRSCQHMSGRAISVAIHPKWGSSQQ